MPTTDAAEQFSEADQPQHPVHAMTTYELRDYRRRLERAVASYAENHPTAPNLPSLRDALDRVAAEQAQRATIARAGGTPAG